MTGLDGFDAAQIDGLGWRPDGQCVLSGTPLQLLEALDATMVTWAAAHRARAYRFPLFLPVRELQKSGYLGSFPQHATFPVCVAPDEQNLRAFARAHGAGVEEVSLAHATPVREVITPAACYHFYVHLQGQHFDAPRYFTTRALCCRREASYQPLQRQWNFLMREIVCIGTAAEVDAFLAAGRAQVDAYLEAIGLPVTWCPATDPFFEPGPSAKRIFQQVTGAKTEAVYDGRLAIASTNVHRDHFGTAFDIQRDGAPACSGCIAFGLERWVLAWLCAFGSAPERWPAPLAMATSGP